MYGDAIRQLDSGAWAQTSPLTCLCGGHGWLTSDFDTAHKCPIHFRGQPHPELVEDEDVYDAFDWDGTRLANLRDAYSTFLTRSGLDADTFRASCTQEIGSDDRTPAAWVRAADKVSGEAVAERLEQDARDQGYSCRLEAAWDAEGRLEAAARRRGVDPEVYATAGSPERADADAWYPGR